MIIKSEDSYSMTCPMALANEEGGRCGGNRCMAWRSVGDGKGFCGMVPALPAGAEEMLRFLEGMNND